MEQLKPRLCRSGGAVRSCGLLWHEIKLGFSPASHHTWGFQFSPPQNLSQLLRRAPCNSGLLLSCWWFKSRPTWEESDQTCWKPNTELNTIFYTWSTLKYCVLLIRSMLNYCHCIQNRSKVEGDWLITAFNSSFLCNPVFKCREVSQDVLVWKQVSVE